MARYAAQTGVSSDRSRAEIEKTLRRYGADQFAYGWESTRAMIGFRMADRQVRFVLPMPDPSDRAFTHTPTGRVRSAETAEREWEQSCRQRWRALSLVVKAKLEAVESGIAEFEEEFLAHIVLPDGSTVAEHVRPAVAAGYESGMVPPMLGLGSGRN